MGASRSKSASKVAIPDINSLPCSERAKAMEDLASTINDQRIAFGFRKVDPDARGQEILKSAAEAIALLPEYTVRVEGHSNLAKAEDKLTDQDKARIQKLSEDRANACAELLKAAGVQNEISCVGLGALKGESKGCVRLMLCKTPIDPQTKVEHHEVHQAEPDLPHMDVDKPISASDTDALVEDALAQTTNKQVLTERSGPEQLLKPTDAEETDGPANARPDALIEPLVGPADVDLNVVDSACSATVSPKEHNDSAVAVESKDYDFAVVVEPQKSVHVSDAPPLAAASASSELGAWGNTHLPWYISCCTQAKAHVDECPMQGLAVKQLQTLQ